MSQEKDKKAESAKIIPLTRLKCPSCQKRASIKFKPFCSKRCADLDLGNWLNGNYAVASDDEPEFDEYQSTDGEDNS